jgi:methionine biosynthesis protein metW
MIWDRVAPLYDLAVNTLNRRVYYGTGSAVARLIRPGDTVLECACGTGTITAAIAPACARVVATDYSEGMLKQAGKKLTRYPNVVVEQADITHLRYADDSFDAVVAANVIHLLPEPGDALKELKRVTRPGGTIIVPTYVIPKKRAHTIFLKLISRCGVHFQEHFDPASYRAFFERMGYARVTYRVVRGRIPCVIASFTKEY